MTNVRRATVGDISDFNYDGAETEQLKTFDWRAQLGVYAALGPVWAVDNGAEVVMLGGFYELSPGVLQAWMLFNRGAQPIVKNITRAIRQKIDDAMSTGQHHRIQTLVVDGERANEKYVRLMGFQREATLEAFGPRKEDMTVYKIVKK